MLKSMKIGTRLYLGFGLMITFLVAIALLGIQSMNSLNSEVRTLSDDCFPKTIWANNIVDQLNLNARAVRNALLAKDAKTKQEEMDKAIAVTPIITVNLDSLKRTVVSVKGKEILKQLLDVREVYVKDRSQLFELINSNRNDEAIVLLFGDMRKSQGNYIDAINKLIAHENEAVNKAGDTATNTASSSTMLLIIIGAIGLIIAIFLAILITKGIVKPISQAVDAANKLSDGDFNADLNSNKQDETGILLKAMNKMKDTIQNLVSDANDLSIAAINGKLDTRANASKYKGSYKDLVDGINDTLDAVIGPLNVAAEYVDRISKGDIPPLITDEYKGDFNEIKNNLNVCMNAVSLLVSDAKMLAEAAVAGKLDTRANASKHQGEFKAIVNGVNLTLDAVIGPLNVAAEYVDRISKGDIPPLITDNYNGDFNEIKNNLNVCIKAVDALVEDAKMLSNAAVAGKLDTRADATKHQGDFKAIVEGVNGTLDAVIGPLNVAAEYVDRIAKGDTPPLITDEYKGDFNEIKNNLNTCIGAVVYLIDQTGVIITAAKDGKLDTRVDVTKAQGFYKKILVGMNDTLDSVIGPLNVAAEYVDRIAKGDIPPKITDSYNGDFNEIKNNLNQCIDNVSLIVKGIGRVSNSVKDGNLQDRGKSELFTGDWKLLVEEINEMVDNFVKPINVTSEFISDIANGNELKKITENYNGDFNIIKNNINICIDVLYSILGDTGMLAKAAVDGKLDTRADLTKYKNAWYILVKGVNDTLDAVIGPLNVAAEYVDRIAKGDIPPKITDNYNGDFNEIKNNLNTAIDAVNALVSDAKMLAKAAIDGKLDTRADATKHQGDFKAIVEGVNGTLDAVIGPLNVAAEYVDRISKGDIPPLITDNYNGDFNEIKNNLNVCINAVDALVADAKILSKAAIDGKLDTRADATKHQGDFKAIVEGVNGTLDAVIGPLNVAAEYVDRIAKGDIPPKITDSYNGDFNEIKNNLNTAIDAVNALVSDAKMLAKAAIDGKLDTRADATKHQGDFKAIVEGVNGTLDAVIGPLNVAAEYVDRIAKGDIPPKITDNYNGDFNEIKNNLNTAIDAVNALVSDAKMLAKAAIDGKLDTRADATKHQGDFKAIVEGVNGTLDAVIGPLNVAAEYVDRISKGDIPPLITDNYNGDFNEIKNNLNVCINAVDALVADAKILSKAAIDGKLDTRADATKHQGDFKAIVEGVNGTLDAVIGPLNVAAEYVDRIAKGDIPPKITDHYNGDFNEIKNNLNTAIDAVNALVNDAKMLAGAAIAGKLDTRADATKHQGDFKAIVDGVNGTLDSVIGPLNVAAEYVDRIAKGDIPPRITDNYNGDFNEIKNNLNTAIDAVNLLVKDASLLVKAAEDGRLSTRADASKHQGDFKAIVDGVNKTLDNVIEPVNDASKVLGILAGGDFTARIEKLYLGDHDNLKRDINHLAESLGGVIRQVSETTLSVSSASVQIASTADTMAASSHEQSSQADEVAAAVQEMSRTVTENAMNAQKTAQMAESNGKVATGGGEVVKDTVTKMRQIADAVGKSAETIERLGVSSAQIGEIISVIDDIADQTNLLALNAAIEAARAGEQGRGFAVVAEEVRKLAERTTQATKQIATMIKGIQSETQEAVKVMNQGSEEVKQGIKLADKAGASLEEIVNSSHELQEMISKIAYASEQQSTTSEEISKNVASISHVTNESSRRIEDVARSAEEMAKLTEQLNELMEQFKVDDSRTLTPGKSSHRLHDSKTRLLA